MGLDPLPFPPSIYLVVKKWFMEVERIGEAANPGPRNRVPCRPALPAAVVDPLSHVTADPIPVPDTISVKLLTRT